MITLLQKVWVYFFLLRNKMKNLPIFTEKQSSQLVAQYSWHCGIPSFQSTSSTTGGQPGDEAKYIFFFMATGHKKKRKLLRH